MVMRPLLKALLTTPHQYFAQLPYNLNWAIAGRSLETFLASNPLNIVDVGARGEGLAELDRLKSYVNYYAFEADEEECRRINASPPAGFGSYQCVPGFIGSGNRSVNFHLYKHRALSSTYRLSERYRRIFAEPDEQIIEKSFELSAITLDQALSNYGPPDFLKLDTQGSELEILRASPLAVQSALMIEIEVEFCELYQSQPLFHEVHEFMLAEGFELLYLNRVFEQRAIFTPAPLAVNLLLEMRSMVVQRRAIRSFPRRLSRNMRFYS